MYSAYAIQRKICIQQGKKKLKVQRVTKRHKTSLANFFCRYEHSCFTLLCFKAVPGSKQTVHTSTKSILITKDLFNLKFDAVGLTRSA